MRPSDSGAVASPATNGRISGRHGNHACGVRPSRGTASSGVSRGTKRSRANAGSARVQSQWSRSHLKASRLSPRYWSFRTSRKPGAGSQKAREQCFAPRRNDCVTRLAERRLAV